MTPNWTRQKIIFELRESGTSAAAIADDVGMSRFTFYGALERPYPKIHTIIACALQRKREEIWPQFYDGSGNRRSGIRLSRAA